MNGTRTIALMGLGALGLIGIQACSGEPAGPEAQTASLDCVEIPDGYYLFSGGKFTPASSDMAMPELPEVTQRSVVWVNELEDQLSQAGFAWIGLDAASGVLVISGTAEDADAREEGLEAVASALAADPALAERDIFLVDGIAISGDDRRPGALLASMRPNPSIEACRTKVDQINRGHSMTYADDNASVAEDSHDMLNAIAGLSRICSAYALEIGVHTDARGAQSFNQTRSQQRAEAIEAYLIEQGIDAEKLVPVGYGETRPIDPAQTSEAYALNRRVEFFFLRGEE